MRWPGWAPRELQDGSWLPEEPIMWLERWNIQVDPPETLGTEEGLEIEWLTNCQWYNQWWNLHKTPVSSSAQRPSELDNTSTCREGGNAQLHGDRGSCPWAPSRTHPTYSFIWPFLCILYNKLVVVRKMFPRVLWIFHQILQLEEGGECRNPWCYSRVIRSGHNISPQHLRLPFNWGQSFGIWTRWLVSLLEWQRVEQLLCRVWKTYSHLVSQLLGIKALHSNSGRKIRTKK